MKITIKHISSEDCHFEYDDKKIYLLTKRGPIIEIEKDKRCNIYQERTINQFGLSPRMEITITYDDPNSHDYTLQGII